MQMHEEHLRKLRKHLIPPSTVGIYRQIKQPKCLLLLTNFIAIVDIKVTKHIPLLHLTSNLATKQLIAQHAAPIYKRCASNQLLLLQE